MSREEYIKVVSEQIRNQKARCMVEKELSDHIEDQAESYEKEGMKEDEAISRAVLEMGDPVETGVELDRIHRPGMEWKFIFMVAFLSMVGLVIQYFLVRQLGGERDFSAFSKHCISVIVGFGCMMAVCYADYSRIGKYAKPLALAIFVLLFFTSTMGMSINGRRQYLKCFFGIYIDIYPIMFLWTPLFGGILYSYKNEGVKGFLKSILWMFLLIFPSFLLCSLSISFILYASMLILLTVSLLKGWFGRHGKKIVALIWTSSIVLPAIYMALLVTRDNSFRAERLKAWFKIGYGKEGVGYVIGMVREFLSSAKWMGAGRAIDDIQLLPGVASDFFLTYLISYYGILVAAVIVSLLGILLLKCFRISLRQKNQLGMMMGLGCSFLFLIQTVLYILVNLTLFPNTSVYLPLFSLGGTSAVVSFLLLGILLSIYRYQNVLPSEPAKSYISIKL